MRILLTASRALISLDIIRNLAKNGHEIFTADSMKFAIGGFSNKIIKRFTVPSVRFYNKEYVEEIIRICKDENIDVLLPLAEEGYYLAEHTGVIKERLPHCIVLVDDIDRIKLLHNKETFYELCKRLEIKTSNTIFVKNANEVKKYITNHNKKMILKKSYSRCGENVIILDNKRKFTQLKKVDFKKEKWIMQDYIIGTPISSFTIGEYSVLYGAKFHNKQGPFSNLYTITDKVLNLKLHNIVKKIQVETGYKGSMGLDFIQDRDGELYVIECNPRITSGLLLMSETKLLDVLLQKSYNFQMNITQKKFIGLMFWQYLTGEVTFTSYKNYLYAMFHYKEIIFDFHDIKPFIMSYLMTCEFFIIAIKNKINVRSASSYDLQYNESK